MDHKSADSHVCVPVVLSQKTVILRLEVCPCCNGVHALDYPDAGYSWTLESLLTSLARDWLDLSELGIGSVQSQVIVDFERLRNR